MQNEKLEKKFKKEISDKCEEVDPSNELDWFALTYGWAIGKGLSIDDAYKFAVHIRYNTDLA